MRTARRIAVLGLLLAGTACSRGSAAGTSGAAPPRPPTVREDGADLSFFWFDSTGAVNRCERISDIPLAARDRVLVQPTGPVREGGGAWAFVADLRQPKADGTFPVQVLSREAYSDEIRARMEASRPHVPDAGATAGPGGPAAAGAGTSGPLPAAGDRVVIYLTQACPHCRRAKEWMTRAGIPFVERDVERDGSAARWLLDHTGTTAVPVFQVGSRVLQGFNPDALRKAVRDELGIQLL